MQGFKKISKLKKKKKSTGRLPDVFDHREKFC